MSAGNHWYAPGYLAQVAAVPVLRGTCNRCGLCCVETREGETYRCTDLMSVAGRLGQPQSSACGVYGERYDGMPIVMRAANGHRIAGRCTKDSATETRVIVARGLGRGCSLTVEGA